MATLIICPACDTRYQIKAAFPPEGRKVRCAKCAHVWQAHSAGTAEAPKPASAPQAAPAAPPAAPAAPPAQPKAPPPPPPPRAAPPAPPPPELPPQAPPPAAPPLPQASPEFEADEALAAQVARINADAMGVPPAPEPEAEPAKKGGLFGKLMAKRGEPAPPPPPPSEMAPPPPQDDTSFGVPPDASPSMAPDASFDAGFPEEGGEDPALADPNLVAAAFGESVPKAKKSRKPLPILTIGWSILALIVSIVVGMFIFAPATTVSMLPGASRIYAMFGMPVGAEGLAFEGVRYGWTTEGGQTVLEVQGKVRNTGSATMAVPTVVIALRDENGDEISEWKTEVGSAELGAGEEAPFLRQIPSPPSNVRSLKVRFVEAK